MNKKMSSVSFAQDFNNSEVEKNGNCTLLCKQTLMAVAMGSVLLASGCASTSSNISDVGFEGNNTSISTMSEASMEIKRITHENAGEILDNMKSGVYQHPVYEDQVVTFEFAQDPNSQSAIEKDIANMGKGSMGYSWSHFLSNVMQSDILGDEKFSDSQSHHIQDPLGLGYDVNFVELNDIDGKSSLGIDFIEENPSFEIYGKYYVMMHEIGHTFDDQQMSVLEIAQSIFTNDMLMMNEVGSDTFAPIMTAQFMNSQGESPENIKIMLDQISDTLSNALHSSINSEQAEDTHVGVGALSIVSNIYEKNPDLIISMTPSQVVDFSSIVAESVVDHNYLNEVYKHFSSQNGEAVSAVGGLIDTMQKKSTKSLDIYNNIVDKLSELARNENTQEGMRSIYQTLSDNSKEIPYMDKDQINTFIGKILLQSVLTEEGLGDLPDKLTVMDIEGQTLIGKSKIKNFPDLNQDFLNKFEGSSLEQSINNNIKAENIHYQTSITIDNESDNEMEY